MPHIRRRYKWIVSGPFFLKRRKKNCKTNIYTDTQLLLASSSQKKFFFSREISRKSHGKSHQKRITYNNFFSRFCRESIDHWTVNFHRKKRSKPCVMARRQKPQQHGVENMTNGKWCTVSFCVQRHAFPVSEGGKNRDGNMWKENDRNLWIFLIRQSKEKKWI